MTCADPSSNPNKRRLSTDALEITDEAKPELRSESVAPSKRQRLHVEIPTFPPNGPGPSSSHGHDTDDGDDDIISGLSEPNSLFDSPMDLYPTSTAPSSLECSKNTLEEPDRPLALRTAPPVPGLFFNPSLRLSQDLCEEVMKFCMDAYFQDENVNQVMLFERAPERRSNSTQTSGTSASGLPPVLLKLLSALEKELLPIVPAETHALLFPSSEGTSPNAGRARQAIINLYHPGEGITPHVDLLKRFGDGIIGASFSSGCVMQFTKVQSSAEDDAGKSSPEPDTYGLYLPERSVVVLSRDARYGWTHGIGKYMEDLVVAEQPADIRPGSDCLKGAGQWIPRGTRMSVTFRFLLPGAEVVGGE